MHLCLTVQKAYEFKYINYNSPHIDVDGSLSCLWVKILAFQPRELENRVRVAAKAIFFPHTIDRVPALRIPCPRFSR